MEQQRRQQPSNNGAKQKPKPRLIPRPSDSKYTQFPSPVPSRPDESPQSPLRSSSPLCSDEPLPPDSSPKPLQESSPEKSNCMAIVAVDSGFYTYSTERSLPPPPPQDIAKSVVPVPAVNKELSEVSATVTKLGSPVIDGSVEEQRESRKRGSVAKSVRERDDIMRNAGLGFRVSEVVLCLISFSVMAADKTQGWSGDSFDRYKEYRYCLSVNVIAFAYSGFQAYNLAYHLVTEKHLIQHHLRYYFDFFMDQVLAYLLISASSSAATRVDDWQSNWGKDDFTEMATASISMAFLAFVAFAFSSLVSGYNLCLRSST